MFASLTMTMTLPSFPRRGLRGGSEASGEWLTHGQREVSTYKTVKTVVLVWIPLFNPRLKSGAIETDSASQTILMVFSSRRSGLRRSSKQALTRTLLSLRIPINRDEAISRLSTATIMRLPRRYAPRNDENSVAVRGTADGGTMGSSKTQNIRR